MNRSEFNIILPSNSSMTYFPLNTTTNYSTRLAREVVLHDKWLVGLSEIHVPCTTLHLRRSETKLVEARGGYRDQYFQHGTYDNINSLVHSINESLLRINNKKECAKLIYNAKGGYVSIKEITDENSEPCRPVVFTNTVKRILGFEEGFSSIKVSEKEVTSVAKHPASLERAIPDQLFIYSNLCEPCMVGDTHAPLLRIVNLEAKKFNFGSTIVKRFDPINFVPLINNRFQIVDIDIRDQFGQPIPFEFGTLTVTLHFKRDFLS